LRKLVRGKESRIKALEERLARIEALLPPR